MAGEIQKPRSWADYIPQAIQRLGLGSRPKEEEVDTEAVNASAVEPIIDKKTIEKAISILKDYKDGKRNLESRIVEEERWWKLRHWDIYT